MRRAWHPKVLALVNSSRPLETDRHRFEFGFSAGWGGVAFIACWRMEAQNAFAMLVLFKRLSEGESVKCLGTQVSVTRAVPLPEELAASLDFGMGIALGQGTGI